MAWILALVAAGAFLVTVNLVRTRWRFTDTPTSDAAHVFPGLSEVCGVVEAMGTPARAASDGSPCVWWKYTVERRVQRKNSTDWVTEEEGVTALPFLVRDASGTVRVVIDPDCNVANTDAHDVENLSLAFLRPHAQVMKRTYEQGAFSQAFGGLFGSNEAEEPISAFSGTWRAKEHRLCVGDRVFITADARLTPDGSAVELARTDEHGARCTFELSVGDEKAAIASRASGLVIGIAAIASVAAGYAFGRAIDNDAVSLFFPVALLATSALLWAIGTWNRVRRTRERCLFAWSLIDVACEQRANLVPQVQAVVGAALAHERSLLEAMAAARSLGRRPSAQLAGTVSAADDAAGQVVARVEAMPELHTQGNVAQLMQQVSLLTDRVAFGRRFYNDSVLRLANRLQQFPDGFFARLGGVTALPYIDANG